MADLSSASFTAVNDVETAQGAPVSEALAQKYGSNENNLDARMTTSEGDILTIEGKLTNLINFTGVSIAPTSLGVKTTLYTVPSNTKAIIQLIFANLPDATGSLGCTIFITTLDGEYILPNPSATSGDGWLSNGASISATGTYLKAHYAPCIKLLAGESIKITRTDRGAIGLNITQYKEQAS